METQKGKGEKFEVQREIEIWGKQAESVTSKTRQ